MNGRNAVDVVAFALQDVGAWLQRRGEILEAWNAPKRVVLGTWASTWEDHKQVRHILLEGEAERALCGLTPGAVHGWENLNNIHCKDIEPRGACPACLAAFLV